ncbi:MAG TPA: hypothetical protein VGX23_12745 [Actinocrinis sp.]|nr:hypothetical protein [Actinocrinis sp.]
MAIVFELVIHFDRDGEEVRDAVMSLIRYPPIVADRQGVPLHSPQVQSLSSGRVELSVVPVGVSHANGMDGAVRGFGLSSDGYSDLGHGLFAILARLKGYRSAFVGWDPEPILDEADPGEPATETGWLAQIEAGYLKGLVFSEEVQREFSLYSEKLVPFAPGYVWVSYQGEPKK